LGGLGGLKPPLTVVKAMVSGDPDAYLPSVMTCANFLKLPEYSTKQVLMKQLKKAITEGQHAFHLS
jgi:E3 ubiquitin-protein ligase TRIP12